MKIYEITIKPSSGFGTPLKGDTIFGHFCWQIAYDSKLIGRSLEELLLNYDTAPFAIFSSMYPKFVEGKNCYFAFITPNLTLDELFNLPEDRKDKIRKRKEYKSKSWMFIKKDQSFKSFKELLFLNNNELLKIANVNVNDEKRKRAQRNGIKKFVISHNQYHNKINRLTNTTSEGEFAPFAVEQQVFYPETELALFVGIDEKVLTIEQIRIGLERIGVLGFGKDASTGLGRFELGKETEIDLSKTGTDSPNACYTLSPCVPEKDTFAEMFFVPFTRFGKHGDVLAKSGNPFKNPVIMADEGAILKPKDKGIFSKPYIGMAISEVSKIEPKTVTQGYSLYIPVEVEA